MARRKSIRSKLTTSQGKKRVEFVRRVKRPLGVTLISIFGFLISGLMLISGAMIASGSMFENAYANFIMSQFGVFIQDEDIASVVKVLSAFPIAAGLMGLGAFYMLYRMRRRALYAITAIGLITIGLSFYSGPDIIVVGVWAVALYYLWRKRDWFE